MAKAIATPMDATVGCLWAEGVANEILLFWRGQRLLGLLGPIGGRSLVMLTSLARYADYGGRAYFFMAILSALGVVGTIRPRRALQRNGNQPTTTDVVTDEEAKNSGSDPPGVWSPQSPHSLSIGSGPRTPRYPRVAQ